MNFAASGVFSVRFGRFDVVASASKVIYKGDKLLQGIYPVVGLFTDISIF